MHPAYSVILFTTASGAGYGLIFWLSLLGVFGFLPIERWFGFTAFGLGFGLITIGLLSSTFHLGHPERAWRAFSQWRSSWLSREGVAAVIAYIPAGLAAIGWVFYEDISGLWSAMALLGALMALITIICTAMIYASLTTIRQWHNPLVVPVYVSLGLATGAVLLNLLVSLFGYPVWLVELMTMAILITALVIKLTYWHRIENEDKAWTIEQATGLKASTTVSQLEAPHATDNFVQREMGYKVARKHADKLKTYTLVLCFLAPILLLGLDVALNTQFSIIVAILSALSAAIGVVIERWLFFAQAQHVVTLFYGAQRA
jgi:sulfite dehydrogenase (quinone) subunit SoeC